MKIKNILMLFSIFALTSLSYAQSTDGNLKIPECTTCNDPKNNIQDNGNNTFTATYAQAYFWQICSGLATIDGSNTDQDVAVIGTVGNSFKIKLTRFINGKCYEYCEESSIIDDIDCPFDPVLTGKADCFPVSGGAGNIKFDTGEMDISNIYSVTWYYDINLNENYEGFEFESSGNQTSTVNTDSASGFNELFTFTGDCPDDDIYFFDALVTFNNDCPNEWINDYPAYLITAAPLIEIYPNPSKSEDQISFEGIDYKKIANIEILN
ncbi:MAG: hypothetical protein GY932_10255, partial [Arcobacter sp.]|nr:hypothetical protein [Arcobacter sp.]